MTEEKTDTRSHVHEIEIDAPIEDVWKAISEADEVTKWFSEEARISPGEGGSYWVSWREGVEGNEQRIDVWYPRRRLRVSNIPPPKDPNAAPLTTPIVMEYTLESRGNRTILRLVHSGIPTAKDWDGFYEGTDYGWDMFFRGLRHYLEKHRGKQRRHFM